MKIKLGNEQIEAIIGHDLFLPVPYFFVSLQLFPVSVSVVGTWCESARTMQVGHMFNLMVFSE
ncbi:MAG: hypothetical protein K6E93_08695 [Bacteroidales bacterium]|nr:hypothetical protein [Bacteroidales bacterium]